VTTYCGPAVGMDYLSRWHLQPHRVGDLEEVLADPRIEAVIVAGPPKVRSAQLRRALQSERHVLCVHPLEEKPDPAYEAAMLQSDTGCVLLPLLPEALHPGIRKLAELARLPTSAGEQSFRLLQAERCSMEALREPGHADAASLRGWDVLRRIGGEIAELFTLSKEESCDANQLVLVSGKFQSGTLFQETFLPLQPEASWRLTLIQKSSRADLLFPQDWPGPAQLTYTDASGKDHREYWQAIDPWVAMVDAFEHAVSRVGKKKERPLPGAFQADSLTSGALGWQDEVRALELDDAARRSLRYGRASSLDYQEATEEASFKGTMTLVGCSLIWLSLLLLIFSIWVPWLGWLILPVFGVFLVLQILGWVVPKRKELHAKVADKD